MCILWKTSFHLQFSSFAVSTKKSEVTQVTPISNLRRNELMISPLSSNFISHNYDKKVHLLFFEYHSDNNFLTNINKLY